MEAVGYLSQDHRALYGGRSPQLLLETVYNDICAEVKSTLLSSVNVQSTNYLEELVRVIDPLVRLKGVGCSVGQNKQGGHGAQPHEQQPSGMSGNSKKNGGTNQRAGQQHAGDQPQVNQQHHKQKEHPKQTSSGGGQANATTSIFKCWNCKTQGHKEADCPAPKKDNYHGSAHQAQTRDNTSDGSSELDDRAAAVWMAMGSANARHETMDWLVDSGATHHMWSQSDTMFGTSPSDSTITVANVMGVLRRRTGRGEDTHPVLLHEVHCVPGLKRNLLSVTELGEHGIPCVFDKSRCRLAKLSSLRPYMKENCGFSMTTR